MNTIIMLHHLRNPYDVKDTEMRKARRQAADELERLYAMETKVKDLFDKMIKFKEDLNK